METPRCGISCEHLPSLLDLFRGLPDSRKGQGKRHRLATTCAIIGCAKLSGVVGGYRAISLYARGLTKPQRRTLHCWINPRTGEPGRGARLGPRLEQGRQRPLPV